jgi:DnaJ-class molecular chaperone
VQAQQFYCRTIFINLCRMRHQEDALMNTPNDQKNQNNQTKPGDEAPSGTPGTGEDICPVCHGSGKAQNGGKCPNCNGTGKVIEGIGGG